jgi:hypothetical protein
MPSQELNMVISWGKHQCVWFQSWLPCTLLAIRYLTGRQDNVFVVNIISCSDELCSIKNDKRTQQPEGSFRTPQRLQGSCALILYSYCLDRGGNSRYYQWLAYWFEFRVQEKGVASFAGRWRAWRGGGLSQICEWCCTFSALLIPKIVL